MSKSSTHILCLLLAGLTACSDQNDLTQIKTAKDSGPLIENLLKAVERIERRLDAQEEATKNRQSGIEAYNKCHATCNKIEVDYVKTYFNGNWEKYTSSDISMDNIRDCHEDCDRLKPEGFIESC